MARVKERGGGGGGEVRKETNLPFPSLPAPHFWLSYHFSRGQNRKSRSSVFLFSETKRKRLLRRLWHPKQWCTFKPEKTAYILRRHHWCPRQVTSEERGQKFHSDDVSFPWSGKCFLFVVPKGNLLQTVRSTTVIPRPPKNYPPLAWQFEICATIVFLLLTTPRSFSVLASITECL